MGEILVTQSSMPTYDEFVDQIKDLWESKWLTNMGRKHQLFQKQLEEYLGVKNVSLYTNGHLALENALSVLDMKKGGEIITTPFTFVSTTHAIVRAGFTPVFCDINKYDYTIDLNKIESLINDNTVAIMPVHVYGNICDVYGIHEIAKRHNLKIIYDAAHSFAETIDGKSVACFGDLSMFSFHATKVFNTIEGGALCFSNDEYIPVLDSMKNFGLLGQESCKYIGSNAKMNEFQAAMGICNLRHIDDEIAKRQRVAQRYRERLSVVDGIKLCEEKENVKYNYAYFPILLFNFKKSRNEVFENLKQNGILARKYFYPIISELECYKSIGADASKTPIAKMISENILCLPIYADLPINEVDKICDLVLC